MNEIVRNVVRHLAIELLDDPNGISTQAWKSLFLLLDENADKDIIDAVQAAEGRHFIHEDVAAKLRQKDTN